MVSCGQVWPVKLRSPELLRSLLESELQPKPTEPDSKFNWAVSRSTCSEKHLNALVSSDAVARLPPCGFSYLNVYVCGYVCVCVGVCSVIIFDFICVVNIYSYVFRKSSILLLKASMFWKFPCYSKCPVQFPLYWAASLLLLMSLINNYSNNCNNRQQQILLKMSKNAINVVRQFIFVFLITK